jgi:hypothetical protein
MIRKQNIAILLVILFSINHLPAQVLQKKSLKKNLPDSLASPNPPTQDATTTDIHDYLFPEFYHYWPIDNNDTILKYQCYDGYNNLINVDTLHNVNNIRHIYFVKSFTNYMHTFIDADGIPKPSTVNKTIYGYDKTDIDSWNSTDYINHYDALLKENKNEIVRVDTTIVTDPVTLSQQLTIRKYYRVTELKPKNQVEEEDK